MTDDRTTLAQQQAALLAALRQQQPPPPGFTADQLHPAATTLANKRLREASLCLPQLSALLADRFHNLFTAYAAATPYPKTGGPLADAAHFTRHLEKQNTLPPQATREALALRLRTGFPIQSTKVANTRRIGFRIARRIFV